MENKTPEKLKAMTCSSNEKLISELEKEGWEQDWSFHMRFPEQWNEACNKVEEMQRIGLWEPILVLGQNEMERKDEVAYIYKRKTEKYGQFEKDIRYK